MSYTHSKCTLSRREALKALGIGGAATIVVDPLLAKQKPARTRLGPSHRRRGCGSWIRGNDRRAKPDSRRQESGGAGSA